MFDDAFHFLLEEQERPGWERLGQHLPYEWIAQAVAYTGKASIRQRRLPAEQVVCDFWSRRTPKPMCR